MIATAVGGLCDWWNKLMKDEGYMSATKNSWKDLSSGRIMFIICDWKDKDCMNIG